MALKLQNERCSRNTKKHRFSFFICNISSVYVDQIELLAAFQMCFV